MDLKKRLMEFVSVNDENGCWEWDGTIRTGYGRFYKDGKMQTAHRVSYEIHVGSTEGLLVLHKCDNKSCVNPEHLFLGTQKDNVRDMVRKNRHKVLKGSDNPNAKLDMSKARKIRDLYADGDTSYAKLAREFNVSPKLIEYVVKKLMWREPEWA